MRRFQPLFLHWLLVLGTIAVPVAGEPGALVIVVAVVVVVLVVVVGFPQSLFAAAARFAFGCEATYSPWLVAALHEIGARPGLEAPLDAALAGEVTVNPISIADAAIRVGNVRFMGASFR